MADLLKLPRPLSSARRRLEVFAPLPRTYCRDLWLLRAELREQKNNMSELKLTATDQTEYDLCKQVVHDGKITFFAVGYALSKIKERQWFVSEGYETFEQFLEGEYGWTKRYGNMMIVNAEGVNSLPEPMRKLITSGRAAQEIAKLPPPLRAVVVEKVVASGKPITATTIKKATPKLPPPAKKKPIAPPPRKTDAIASKTPSDAPRDGTGLEIPAEVLDYWNRSGEAEELITYLSVVKKSLKKAQEANDLLYSEVDFGECLNNVAKLQTELCRAVAHCVCPGCQGKIPKGCLLCRGKGLISEWLWKSPAVTEEQRAMRKDLK